MFYIPSTWKKRRQPVGPEERKGTGMGKGTECWLWWLVFLTLHQTLEGHCPWGEHLPGTHQCSSAGFRPSSQPGQLMLAPL